MAVGKEAPILPCCAVAAANRQALDATVAKFTETLASVPLATVKKRLKESKIDIHFANGSPAPNGNAAAAASNGYTPLEIDGLDKNL